MEATVSQNGLSGGGGGGRDEGAKGQNQGPEPAPLPEGSKKNLIGIKKKISPCGGDSIAKWVF